VVVLETNNSVCSDFVKIIDEAVEKYPYTDWRMAMFHHDIYGDGITHSQRDATIKDSRRCITEAVSKYKFDLVINGHDHVYTASKFITYKETVPFYSIDEVSQINKDPEGTLFITANCSSGSKYLDFEPFTPEYVYNHTQTFSPTFGVLDFKTEKNRVKLTITSYEVETYEITDGPYTIEKKIVEKPKTTTTSIPTSTTTTTTTETSTTRKPISVTTEIVPTKATKTITNDDAKPTKEPKEVIIILNIKKKKKK